jgi:hypothetical protein
MALLGERAACKARGRMAEAARKNRASDMKARKLPVYRYKGKGFRACGKMCADNFRTDRKLGLLYPAVKLVNGSGEFVKFITAQQYSLKFNACAYCGKEGGR